MWITSPTPWKLAGSSENTEIPDSGLKITPLSMVPTFSDTELYGVQAAAIIPILFAKAGSYKTFQFKSFKFKPTSSVVLAIHCLSGE